MSMKTVTVLLVWSLLFSASALTATSYEDLSMTQPKFFVDYAVFADSDRNRLEVYYKVFNDALKYIKKGNNYIANYEINVIVLGKKERQITGTSLERSYVLADYAHTQSAVGYLINQVNLRLDPGEYILITKLIDHNSNDVSTIERKFVCPRFKSAADISGIEFIQELQVAEQPPQFVKGDMTAVPVVERFFDGDGDTVGFYADLYVGDHIGKQLTLKYAIRSEHGSIDKGEMTVIPTEKIASVKGFISLDGLRPGDYGLVLDLRKDNHSLATRSAAFLIRWSLDALVRNDIKYAAEQLKYIAAKDERKFLTEPNDTIPSQERFDAFWLSKDPTPGTPRNELKDEYYRRIRYANQYFRAINREGWKTDRGMVYIKYGEPDQIDNHPFELERKPYLVWYYYMQRRTFVFEDSRGDGDYQLEFPYDGDWTRLPGH